jgi:putative addiction module component (TIGR02574 family)
MGGGEVLYRAEECVREGVTGRPPNPRTPRNTLLLAPTGSYNPRMDTDPILQQALSLSPEGRVRLIDELLESVVVADSTGGELDQAQKAELLRRLAADRADPGAAISWDQAKKQFKRPA